MKRKYKVALSCLVVGGVFCLSVGGTVYHYHESSVHHARASHPVPTAQQYLSYHTLPFSKHKSQSQSSFANSAKSAFVMDSKTGKVEYQKNSDHPRKVASTAKLMTLYLAYSKLNHGHSWNEKVKISNNVAKMSNDTANGVGSEFKLQAGHSYTVKDLYQSTLIESSDSASIALGEWVAGSNPKFVKLMNQQAKAWHLTGHFNSASGLENDSLKLFNLQVAGGKTDGNSLTARDLAVIAQHLLKAFPKITDWSKLPSANIQGTQIANVNSNLDGQSHAVAGCDGLKTGFTPSAGYCYVGTKKHGNSHRIIVLLNGPSVFSDGQNIMNNI